MKPDFNFKNTWNLVKGYNLAFSGGEGLVWEIVQEGGIGEGLFKLLS